MNLSKNWLKSYIDLGNITDKEYASAMTMSGSKVEGFENIGEKIQKVVVGKILEVEKHPNADKLVVCKVDVGDECLQIVTGASNVNAGDLVPVCLNGGRLPDGTVIKKGKLRGVESNGMLCSLSELGLTVSDFPYAIEDGIFILQEDCEVGQDIREVLGLNDTIFEFEITSNRPDCLSVIGLARETAATFGLKANIKEPVVKGTKGTNINDMLKVKVKDPDLCQRYCARAVKNVKIEPSPKWIRERLRHSGVRPINNIVDITNYVMLEYGQPMHAFDASYIEGGEIIVRRAKEGETIVTLDEQERKLDPSMLLIADAKKPIALAGIMGGLNSEIIDSTTTVIFESANFDAATVRRGSKKVGLRTESSSRFEKGLDPNIALLAINRACELIEMLNCGEVVEGIIDIRNIKERKTTLKLDVQYINKFLGSNISRERMVEILESLNFTVDADNNINIPTFRTDIEYIADIAEEIARIYGYNNIPSTIFKGPTMEGGYTRDQKIERKVSDLLVSLGLSEIYSYTFISPKSYDKLMLPADSPIRKSVVISNPLGEDTSVMRTTILSSMLEILSNNYNHRNPAAALFEIGKVFIPDINPENLPNENKKVAIGMYGNGDFYNLKGIIVEALSALGIDNLKFSKYTENQIFHPGRCAAIYKDNTYIGIMGELHPLVAENYEIGVPVYIAELDFESLASLYSSDKEYKPLPKYPAVTRDIAVLCNDSLEVAEIENIIINVTGKLLDNLSLFDVYKGSQIEAGKKSVAYSIKLRAEDRTLTDNEIDNIMNKIIKRLEQSLTVY